ncbi:MAG: hypothetical protein GC179_27830 [Anaerolineaceae bacterium]|nr:hypothetical protein [Anaerolineaceae bacterium]
MQYDHDSTTLTPQYIVDSFQSAYRQVYGRDAQVVHMFAEWYTVNGETVHRMTLFSETSRLRELVRVQQSQQTQRPQPRPAADRSMVQRLIARLRGV